MHTSQGLGLIPENGIGIGRGRESDMAVVHDAIVPPTIAATATRENVNTIVIVAGRGKGRERGRGRGRKKKKG